jgi:glycerophosphoryl diester phosphodiesterase
MINNKFILAHRGYSDIAPENTQLAFESAFNFGFDGIELDVHQTKDGKLVIIHDETTGRTSNQDLKIETSNYKDLNKLDYSYNFKTPNLPIQNLLTLEDFLEIFFNKFALINLEIKTDEIAYPGIEKAIHDVIKKLNNYQKKILISSFNFASLEIMQKLDAKVMIGFLYFSHRDFLKIKADHIKKICNYLNPSVKLYLQHKSAYDKLSLPYNLWTIKSNKVFNKLCFDPQINSLICNEKF